MIKQTIMKTFKILLFVFCGLAVASCMNNIPCQDTQNSFEDESPIIIKTQKGTIPNGPNGTYFIICEIEHEGKRHEIMMTSCAPYGNVYSSPEHWPSCKYCNQIQENGL